MNATILIAGMLFSCVGLGLFIYGRRQGATVPLVCGITLMIYPYFVSSLGLLVGIGLALCAIPYFYRP